MDNKIDGLNNLSAAGAEAACDASLATYDPPTKIEMDNKIDGLNNLSAANVATELATYDPPTKTEMDNKIDGLNNLSAANIATELATYDGIKRSEATTDKNEIITDINDVKGTGFVKDTNSLVNISGSAAVNLTIGGIDVSIEDG
jgi:hypothetical protein